MGKITFRSKETFASFLNALTVFNILNNGGAAELAAGVGSVFESIVKGFQYEHSQAEQMKSIMQSVIEKVLKDGAFELPIECKVQMQQKLFSEECVQEYLFSDNQYEALLEQIRFICSQYEECDISTLPVEQIAYDIVQELNNNILDNHELTGQYAFHWIQQIHEDVVMNKKLLQELCAYFTTRIENPIEDIGVLSRKSAEKIAQYYSDVLFADYDSSVPKKISDVYIESCFESTDGSNFDDFDELFDTLVEGENLLIEGDPGSGKSTQVMSLAERYLRGQVFQQKKVFFVRGKDIRHSNGHVIEDIKKCTGVATIDELDDAILILDAYDEISYVSQGTDQNKAYLRQLELEFEFATLIVTSRPNYIKGFSGKKVKILGFSPFQRKMFLEKYNCGKEGTEQLTEEFIDELTLDDSQYDDGISELLSIPMMLYLIAVKQVDVGEISDRYALYESVFGTKSIKGAIHQERKITQSMWDELYALATEIAHNMYMSNELYINYDSILKMIDNMNLDDNLTSMLKNRFGIEIYLKGTDDKLFTFIHTSIYEFFAAKWICNKMKDLFSKYLYDNYPIGDIIHDLNITFNSSSFNAAIFRYLMENIQEGQIDAIHHNNELKLRKLLSLFNQLLNDSVCANVDGKVPNILRQKNMLLWIFNTFNVFFGRFEIDENPYWVTVNPDIVSFLIRSMENHDFLFLSRLDLTDFHMEKTDFGNTYFVDINLKNASFSYSYCNDITTCGQHFDFMKMKSVDFYDSALNNCSFENTDLRFSDFRDSIIENVSFRGADLRGVFLNDAFFFKCDFTDTHIRLSDFENATLEECCIDNAIVHSENEDPNDAPSLGQFVL